MSKFHIVKSTTIQEIILHHFKESELSGAVTRQVGPQTTGQLGLWMVSEPICAWHCNCNIDVSYPGTLWMTSSRSMGGPAPRQYTCMFSVYLSLELRLPPRLTLRLRRGLVLLRRRLLPPLLALRLRRSLLGLLRLSRLGLLRLSRLGLLRLSRLTLRLPPRPMLPPRRSLLALRRLLRLRPRLPLRLRAPRLRLAGLRLLPPPPPRLRLGDLELDLRLLFLSDSTSLSELSLFER